MNNTYILLVRGINVDGKHILPMKRLTLILHNLGLYNIKTYIQSGNAVFQSEKKVLTSLSTPSAKR